jgi:mannose-1-phosphate guanylyltransferase
MVGFILAAGLGTRIAALSRLMPKPLLPVGPTTPFDRAVDALRAGGCSRVIANASHLAAMVQERGRAREVEVVVEEGGPFGTAGGLHNANIDADAVAIWNGDIVADIDVGALFKSLRGGAVLAVRGHEPRGGGNVGIDASGRIVRLRKQSFGDEARGAWFAAVQVLARSLVQAAPERGCLVGDVLIPALSRGIEVTAMDTRGAWHDVGDPRSYLEANVSAPMIDPSARIDRGVTIEQCVIGRDAIVSGTGALHRVVVWPGAHAVAPLADCIVTPEGVVDA